MDTVLIFMLTLGATAIISLLSYLLSKRSRKLVYVIPCLTYILSILGYMLVMIVPTASFSLALFYSSISMFNASCISVFVSWRIYKKSEKVK